MVRSAAGVASMSSSPPTVIRIMCVDDHPIFRQGLAAVIANEPSLQLVAEAADGEEAIRRYPVARPDVTLMDLRLPGINGVETIIALRRAHPDARIVVLTTESGDAQIQRALVAGAKGYVLKDMAMSELLRVVQAAHAGRTSIPAPLASHIAEHLGDRALTAREVEVLKLIARGYRNRSVGAALAISEETVKMHVKNAMAKLNANDRTHAVTIAIQRGFITI